MGKGGFSWKRVVGISAAKSKISRSIGIPLTKGGRQRKFGAALGGSILGGVVAPKRKQSRSVDNDVDATPEIPPHEKNPYGIPTPGTGLTCLTLTACLVLSIVFFPFGIAVGLVLFGIVAVRANNREEAAIKELAVRKCF